MKKYTLSNEQQHYLDRLLVEMPYPTRSEVTQIARNLLLLDQEQVETMIKEQVRKEAERKARQADRLLRRFMVLKAPLPKNAQPEILYNGPNGEVVKRMPSRQSYTVYVKDLDSFCKEHGLNRDRIMEVAEGRISGYKGWERNNKRSPLDNPLCIGKPYQEPDTSKPGKLNPDPNYKPSVQWQPSWEMPLITYSPQNSN